MSLSGAKVYNVPIPGSSGGEINETRKKTKVSILRVKQDCAQGVSKDCNNGQSPSGCLQVMQAEVHCRGQAKGAEKVVQVERVWEVSATCM